MRRILVRSAQHNISVGTTLPFGVQRLGTVFSDMFHYDDEKEYFRRFSKWYGGRFFLSKFYDKKKKTPKLNFFRRDREMIGWPNPKHNITLSIWRRVKYCAFYKSFFLFCFPFQRFYYFRPISTRSKITRRRRLRGTRWANNIGRVIFTTINQKHFKPVVFSVAHAYVM